MEGSNLSAHRGLRKIIISRLKSGGMGLFDYLFVCIVILGVLCYYVVKEALRIIRS